MTSGSRIDHHLNRLRCRLVTLRLGSRRFVPSPPGPQWHRPRSLPSGHPPTGGFLGLRLWPPKTRRLTLTVFPLRQGAVCRLNPTRTSGASTCPMVHHCCAPSSERRSSPSTS